MKIKNSNLFYVNLTYFFVLILFISIRLLYGFGVFNSLNDILSDAIFDIMVQVVLMGIVPVVAFNIIKRQNVKQTLCDFKFKKINHKVIIYSILLGILMFLFNISVATVFDFILSFFGYEATSIGGGSNYSTVPLFLYGLLTTAIMPAIFEETMHRGMLLNSYKRLGVWPAIILSSLLFGLMHLNIGQFFYATILGIIMAITVLCSGSIWPAIILHFINNGASVFLSFASQNNLFGVNVYGFLNYFTSMFGGVFDFIISFALIGLIVWGMIILIGKIFKESRGTEIKQKLKTAVMKDVFNIDTEESVQNRENVKEFIVIKPMGLNGEDFVIDYKALFASDKPIEMLNDTNIKKADFKENIFLYGSIFLGAIVTIFTFIWGIL